MCDPLSIGSAIATGLGTVMQMSAQNRAQNNIRNVIQQNADKQTQLQQQSSARAQDAAQNFTRAKFDQGQQEATAADAAKYKAAQSQGALPGEYYGDSVGDNVKAYQELKSKDASAYTDRYADALAKLTGFTGGIMKPNNAIRDAGEQVQLNSNYMAGNNAILPVQLEAAKQSGQSPFGDILTGLGSAGLSAGLTKAIPAVAYTPLGKLAPQAQKLAASGPMLNFKLA